MVGADISESGLEVRRNNQYSVCSIIRQEVSRVASDTGIVQALALLPPHWGLTTTSFG